MMMKSDGKKFNGTYLVLMNEFVSLIDNMYTYIVLYCVVFFWVGGFQGLRPKQPMFEATPVKC